MSKHYLLDCAVPESADGEALLRIDNTFRVGQVRTWKSGKPHQPDRLTFPQPILIEFEPLRGYQGGPVELLDLGIPIMSDRLHRAIVGAGVTTVEWFDATLRDRTTGREHPYKAYNVVALIAAADLAASRWDSAGGPPAIDASFDQLVLDPARTGDALLFRLAENVNALVIHQVVRDAIERAGIDTVRFLAPGDWVQI